MAKTNAWVTHNTSSEKLNQYWSFHTGPSNYSFNGLADVYKPKLECVDPYPLEQRKEAIDFTVFIEKRILGGNDFLIVGEKALISIKFNVDRYFEFDLSLRKSTSIWSAKSVKIRKRGYCKETEDVLINTAFAKISIEDNKLYIEAKTKTIFELEVKIGAYYQKFEIEGLNHESFHPRKSLHKKILDFVRKIEIWDDLLMSKFRDELQTFVLNNEVPKLYVEGIYEFLLFKKHTGSKRKNFTERISRAKSSLLPFFTYCEIARWIVLYSAFILNDWKFIQKSSDLFLNYKSCFQEASTFFLQPFELSCSAAELTQLSKQEYNISHLPIMTRDFLCMQLLLGLSRNTINYETGLELIIELKNLREDTSHLSYKLADTRELLVEARFMKRFKKMDKAQFAYKKLRSVDDNHLYSKEIEDFIKTNET
jgi:hypothetical protein